MRAKTATLNPEPRPLASALFVLALSSGKSLKDEPRADLMLTQRLDPDIAAPRLPQRHPHGVERQRAGVALLAQMR